MSIAILQRCDSVDNGVQCTFFAARVVQFTIFLHDHIFEFMFPLLMNGFLNAYAV